MAQLLHLIARVSVQMGIHEEELLWLAERVKHIKENCEEGAEIPVQLEAGVMSGGSCQRQFQITREENGFSICTDAETKKAKSLAESDT